MARPKSYDRAQALERACYAFWEHGYVALGIRELEQLTGLNKFAIRNEFGGKEGLYLEALKFYSDATVESILAPMRTGDLDSIATFFSNLVVEGSANASPWGCLMVNTGIENAELRRPALKTMADAYWDELDRHFRSALQRAINDGQIKPELDIAHISKGLVTAVMGIHTKNRSDAAHNAGQALVLMVLTLLDTWRL